MFAMCMLPSKYSSILSVLGAGIFLAITGSANGADEAFFARRVTILPDTYFTLVSPGTGSLDASPVVGKIYAPLDAKKLSGYVQAGDGPSLEELQEKYQENAIAHVAVDAISTAKYNLTVDTNRKIFAAFQLPYDANNPAPWSIIAHNDEALATVEQAIFEKVRASLLEGKKPPHPQDVPSSFTLANADPDFSDILSFVRERTPGSKEDEILRGLIEVLAWVNKPTDWLITLGVTPTPYGAPVWAPNQTDLIQRQAEQAPILLTLPRAHGFVDFVTPTSLGRFCSYWSWVKSENITDENDKWFLRFLSSAASISIKDNDLTPTIDATLAECKEAQLAQLSNVVLAAAVVDALITSKIQDFQDEGKSRALLAAAIERVKSGAGKIGMASREQLLPPPQDLPKVMLSKDVIDRTALMLTFGAYRQAQQAITWEAVLWLVQQLRPSLSYRGRIIGVREDVGHVTRHGTDDFNKLKDQYGRPYKPQDLPADNLFYSLATPTQTLPLGYKERSLTGALMPYRADVSDYLSFAITNGKGVESLYDTFSSIEARTAAAISPSVVSANSSQNPDQMLAVDQSAEMSLLAMYAELARAGEEKRAELMRAEEGYFDTIDRQRLGYLFVADDALVVASLHEVGRINSGEAIAVVRPVFSNEIIVDLTTREQEEYGIAPGNTFPADVSCPGVFPLSPIVLAEFSSTANRDEQGHAMASVYRKYLDSRKFQATVVKIEQGVGGGEGKATVHFRIFLAKPDRRVARADVENADIALANGFLVPDPVDANMLFPAAGALEPGRRCDVTFKAAIPLDVDSAGRQWWNSLNEQ